ncbi:MAG: hypothetical protein AAFZ15_07775 [Bacteroidota bacterium]
MMAKEKSSRLQVFIILFNCQEEVKTYEEIAQLKLQPINNFVEIIEQRFKKYFKRNRGHLTIIAPDYKIYCGTENGSTRSREIDIYGEKGLLEFIALAKENKWKIFDKGLDCFIDLDFPKHLSYTNYKNAKRPK